ncbi:MAG: hypothetical protein CUN54_10425, partial [Phototrophicales bacterium]
KLNAPKKQDHRHSSTRARKIDTVLFKLLFIPFLKADVKQSIIKQMWPVYVFAANELMSNSRLQHRHHEPVVENNRLLDAPPPPLRRQSTRDQRSPPHSKFFLTLQQMNKYINLLHEREGELKSTSA